MIKGEHLVILQELKASYESATNDTISRLEKDYTTQLKLENEQAIAQIEMLNQSRRTQIDDLEVTNINQLEYTIKTYNI